MIFPCFSEHSPTDRMRKLKSGLKAREKETEGNTKGEEVPSRFEQRTDDHDEHCIITKKKRTSLNFYSSVSKVCTQLLRVSHGLSGGKHSGFNRCILV